MKENRYNEETENTRDMIEEAFASSNWFQFPKVFLLILSPPECILLSYLINHAHKVQARKEDGWFYCKMDKITEDLFQHTSWQSRIVQLLKTKGYIDTEIRGLPATRWIKIDYAKLRKDIDDYHDNWLLNRRKRDSTNGSRE